MGLRVTAKGTKSFIFRYWKTDEQRQRIFTLGSYDSLTLNQARQEARRLHVDIFDGVDPMEARQTDRDSDTVGSLCDAYMEKHSRMHKVSWREDECKVRLKIKPAWERRKAHSIKRSEVSELHRQIGVKQPSYANRVIALIRHMYNWGEREGYLPEGHPNPVRGIQMFREYSRDRWATRAEVRGIMQAASEEKSPYVQAYFWLVLLLGTQKRELLAVQWKDVDFERETLRLTKTKSGRKHELPLSRQALSVLQGIPRQMGNPFVFPGLTDDKAMCVAVIDQAWRRMRKKAGCPDLWVHDLRRTVGSWMAQSGASLHLIGSVLNQTTPTVTAVYARFAESNIRNALEGHAEALMLAAGEGGGDSAEGPGVEDCP